MKNEEIKNLYNYCKNQGYNESEEKFEEDLKQLVIEEIESDNLKNISGGKIEMNKKVAAGLLSLLSLGGSMNSTYAGFKSKLGVTSEKSESQATRSSDNLKKILLGGAGATLVGGGVMLSSALMMASKLRDDMDPKEVFEKLKLDDTEVLSNTKGNTVYFYWREGNKIHTAKRPKMSKNLVKIVKDGLRIDVKTNLMIQNAQQTMKYLDKNR